MVLTLKFIGALRHASGKTHLSVSYAEDMSVKKLLAEVTGNSPKLEKTFRALLSGDSSSDALVLVNGREISALDGLETKLCDGDEIVFVPVVHGG